MKSSAIPVVSRLTATMRRILYSKWFGGAVFLCLVVGTILWFVTRERLPRRIQIATAKENGQYDLFGTILANSMTKPVAMCPPHWSKKLLPLSTKSINIGAGENFPGR